MTDKNDQVETVKPKPVVKPVTHDVALYVEDPKPYWASCSCGWKSDGYLDKGDAEFMAEAHGKGQ